MAVHDLELMRKQEYLDGYFINKRKTKRNSIEKCREIQACIAQVEDADEMEFLVRRYIQNQKMEVIAGLMAMSRATVYRLQTMALEDLEIPEGWEK